MNVNIRVGQKWIDVDVRNTKLVENYALVGGL